MKNIYWTILLSISVVLSGCDDWLDRDPKTIIDENQAYSSESVMNSIISAMYYRLPDWGGIYQDPGYYTQLDEGMLGQNVNNFIEFNNDYARYYEDGYILLRDINYHLNKIKNTNVLSADKKKYYIAEARFLRAYVYFELVKRMGGIPLIEDVLIYDSDIPVTSYQVPRAKEEVIYDFIKKELEESKNDLSLPSSTQYNRASKGAALALESRAMLYAGTLAKYNSAMGIPVILPGGEVGIPQSRSGEYLQASLNAATELLEMDIYSLYDLDSDKSKNFYKTLIASPEGGINKEVIFIKEFKQPTNIHDWTYRNLPRTMREGGFSGIEGTYINPSLNLVDAFEYKDGTSGKVMPYTDPNHRDETGGEGLIDGNPDSYIYFDKCEDIFKDRDPRLSATIITPGSVFAGDTINLRAGIALYNQSTAKLEFKVGSLTNGTNHIKINGDSIILTADDGPSNDTYSTRTGFYVRKSMDEKPNDNLKKSAIQFVRYRLSEVYLNAAEAAFELGFTSDARDYIKKVRERAGVATGATTTLEQIRNERRVELAFEGHRYFDLKRWRIADEIFDGNVASPTAMIYGLWPYRVYRPGHATHNKWIYVRKIPVSFTAPRKFVRSNYYSSFSSGALSANPKLIKNPGH